MIEGPSWLWWYGSWIYNYLCNQCLSSLKLWVQIPLIARCTRYNIVCQWLATGRWFSPGHQVSSINSTCLHDITEILLKVALNNITLNRIWYDIIIWIIKQQKKIQVLKEKTFMFVMCILFDLHSSFYIFQADKPWLFTVT
jgi:hypothetical protein